MSSPRNAKEANRQATCQLRAMEILPELRKGSMYVAHMGGAPGVYDVQKRGYDQPDTWYTDNLLTTTCDCPDFVKHGDLCKHTLAVELYDAELAAEEQCRQFEDAECATGTDGNMWIDLRYAA